jgi:hypothetical protein
MQQIRRAFWASVLQDCLLHLQLNVHAPCKFFLKPIEESKVKNLKIGPQQVCHITFKAEQNSDEKLRLN